MKKIIAATAVAILFSATAAQAADEGVYARLDTGWSFSQDGGKDLDDDFGNSPIIGAGVGYRLNQYVRGDLTVGYRGGYEVDTSGDIAGFAANAKGDVSSLAAMANVYVDVAKFGAFTPYVGGGIGFSRNKLDDVDGSVAGVNGKIDGDTETSFAWQLSAGVGIEVAPKWTVDVGYRYIDLGEVKTGNSASLGGVSGAIDPIKADLKAHEIQASVRYQF